MALAMRLSFKVNRAFEYISSHLYFHQFKLPFCYIPGMAETNTEILEYLLRIFPDSKLEYS